jgi:hypothetical protein
MSRHSESLWRLERWRQKRETPVAEAGTEDINDYVSENGPFLKHQDRRGGVAETAGFPRSAPPKFSRLAPPWRPPGPPKIPQRARPPIA